MLPVNEFDRLRIVLVETRNPLNIGAAARAMSNFGALRLRLVNPYQPSFREARSAVGRAAEVLSRAEEFTSLADSVADCSLVVGTTALQNRHLRHAFYDLASAAGLIRPALKGQNVALIFGSEKTGLSVADLSYCHWLLHIPTQSEHLSMNLGQAVAVTLYELSRPAAPESLSIPPEQANSGDLERLAGLLSEALQICGYTPIESSATAEERTRSMLHRMNLTSRDAEQIQGMLRQILWKMNNP